MGADAGQTGPSGRGGRRDRLPALGGGTHRGVLPVEDDLRDVLHGVQEVIVSPLMPVDGHRAVFVHAARHMHGHPRGRRPHLSAATPPPTPNLQGSQGQARGHQETTGGTPVPEEKGPGGSTPHLAQTQGCNGPRAPRFDQAQQSRRQEEVPRVTRILTR